MKRLFNIAIAACLAIVIVIAAAALLACHKDDDDRPSFIPSPPVVSPTVECCDFSHRDKCRDLPVERFEKLLRRGDVCLDKKGRCFERCPR